MVPYGSIVYYHIVKSYVWRARSLAFEQFYTRYVIHFCMHLWVRVWVRMNVWEFQCQSSNLNINFASKFCGFVCSFVSLSLSLNIFSFRKVTSYIALLMTSSRKLLNIHAMFNAVRTQRVLLFQLHFVLAFVKNEPRIFSIFLSEFIKTLLRWC